VILLPTLFAQGTTLFEISSLPKAPMCMPRAFTEHCSVCVTGSRDHRMKTNLVFYHSVKSKNVRALAEQTIMIEGGYNMPIVTSSPFLLQNPTSP
jgi:hypothetical protein